MSESVAARRKYRCKYELAEEFGVLRHTWSVVGAKGALHLWIREAGAEPSGGVEIHWRSPPEWMADQPPSQDSCWLLGSPCWHDGSSLQASEIWIPRWQSHPHDHELMFADLRDFAEEHFSQPSEG